MFTNLADKAIGFVAAAAIASGAFWAYTAHEQHVGQAKIIAADTAVATAAVTHNTQVETTAHDTLTQLASKLETTLAAPVTKPAVSGVRHVAPSSSPVRQDAPAGQSCPSASEQPELVQLSPELIEQRFKNDDAIISYWQGYYTACVTAGICAAE